ncbi:hypothetical protein Micbo1qcDRAFT_232469 [Microdochium bolleyi]|uniref:DNA (cytosine-5)-methyltransferase 1 replication foci domain-containing protein n=1 Tax=Microdochium bolleyi TaxID=196109 RepID=A0A136J6G1_9PEZI|nr:hypothetical protein Micbo1qcDRAFT_232469 [Microdochium bolleyi]
MPPRRKRALSNSTVATVDEATVPYFRESSVLKKVPPAVHNDDWPCFLLLDATIYDKHGQMASQLDVDLEGPFVIRGRLALDKDQESRLISRSGKNRDTCVQIENSASFAVALKEEENGPPLPVLWASGEAGWYEIVPSDKYKAIGHAMFQAISLHYSVIDQYNTALQKLKKKKGKKKSLSDVHLELNEVLFQFAVQEGEGLTLPEAIQRCDDNAIFFLSHFQKSLPFYKWLADKHPDVVSRLANRTLHDSAPINIPGLEAADPADPRYRVKSQSHDTANSTSRRGRGGSRQQSTNSLVESDPKPVDLASRPKRKSSPTSKADVEMKDTAQAPQAQKVGFDALLAFLEDERKDLEAAKAADPRKKSFKDLTPKSWHTKVYLSCSIANYGGGTDVCTYYAAELARQLGPEWHDSQLYRWAQQNVNTKPTFEHITEEKILSMVRRQKKPRGPLGSTTAVNNAAPCTPQATSGGKQLPHPGRTGGKQSILRPVYSKKRARGFTGSDDDDDEMDLDDEGGAGSHQPKRYRRANGHASSSSSEDDEDGLPDSPLAKLVVTAEGLPSTFASGPNSTWTCEEPDCGYVVRGADDDEGQELINAHYEEHEEQAREMMHEMETSRVNLAMQEGKKGHLPIDHLLEKIRGLSGSPAGAAEAMLDTGELLPRPIKRSLLI